MKRWSMDAYCMLEDPDGEWVKYEDVQKIKQDKTRALFRNSELVMENSRLKELNREMDIKEPCEKIVELEAENARLNEALHSIHNYIANPEHYDILTHMLAIDKMALNALYGGEGE